MTDRDPNRSPNENDAKDWQLDALLDSLLRSYSAAEPRPGFETQLRAVARAQAMRARRTGWLMLAASAAAVALFAWMMIASPHKTKTNVAGTTVEPPQHAKTTRAGDPAHESSPAATTSGSAVVSHPAVSPKNRRLLERPADIRNDKANRIVLQMVEATQGSGSLVFEHEKLYLSPEKPSETETAAASAPEQETQAPAVSIKSIGVASIESNAPIEIKDLAPPKSSSEKGSL